MAPYAPVLRRPSVNRQEATLHVTWLGDSTNPFPMIQPRFTPPMLLFQSLVPLLTPLVAFAVAKTNPPAETKASYALAQAIPVTCLNRTTYVCFVIPRPGAKDFHSLA